jgi:hypothetical protein
VTPERLASDIPLYSWADFTFKVTVDELGQWDVLTTVYYESDIEFTHKTSFMSDFWVAEKIVSTDIDVSAETLKGLFMSEENFIAVKTLNKIIFFEEKFYIYLADVLENRIVTRDLFEEVEIVYDQV